jgi:hypothetical protein
MPTENLSHIASALQINISGSARLRSRNLRFRLHASLRKVLDNIASGPPRSRSSASVADFFNSFESHSRLVLVSIAALQRVPLAPRATINEIRLKITNHIISGC